MKQVNFVLLNESQFKRLKYLSNGTRRNFNTQGNFLQRRNHVSIFRYFTNVYFDNYLFQNLLIKTYFNIFWASFVLQLFSIDKILSFEGLSNFSAKKINQIMLSLDYAVKKVENRKCTIQLTYRFYFKLITFYVTNIVFHKHLIAKYFLCDRQN